MRRHDALLLPYGALGNLDTLACTSHIHHALVPGNTSSEYDTGDTGKGGDPDEAAGTPAWGDAGAWCNHAYPIAVRVYDGGRRAQCLRCLAVGPVRSDPDAARLALIEERSKR